MKSVSLSSERHLDTRQKPRILDRLAFKLVIQQLKKIQLGRLVPTVCIWSRRRSDCKNPYSR